MINVSSVWAKMIGEVVETKGNGFRANLGFRAKRNLTDFAYSVAVYHIETLSHRFLLSSG